MTTEAQFAARGHQPGARKAEKPARARELASKGTTAQEIARSLGVSTRTVGRYLKE